MTGSKLDTSSIGKDQNGRKSPVENRFNAEHLEGKTGSSVRAGCTIIRCDPNAAHDASRTRAGRLGTRPFGQSVSTRLETRSSLTSAELTQPVSLGHKAALSIAVGEAHE